MKKVKIKVFYWDMRGKSIFTKPELESFELEHISESYDLLEMYDLLGKFKVYSFSVFLVLESGELKPYRNFKL